MEKALLKIAIAAAAEKKATDIKCFDMVGKSDLCAYQMICSAANEKQTVAIADAIEHGCKVYFRLAPAVVEGRMEGQWLLMDYGSILIHIFLESQRAYYDIEALWPVSLPVASL